MGRSSLNNPCRSVVSGGEVVTGEVRKIHAQEIPRINSVLRTGLPGVDILAQQLFRAEQLATVRRENLYWNYRIAEVAFKQAMHEVARPVVKAEISGVAEFVGRGASPHIATTGK